MISDAKAVIQAMHGFTTRVMQVTLSDVRVHEEINSLLSPGWAPDAADDTIHRAPRFMATVDKICTNKARQEVRCLGEDL